MTPGEPRLDERGLYQLLDREGVPYDLHRHPPVFTVAAAEALGLPEGAIPLKNLFLRDDKHRNWWLVSMPADKALDLKRLRAQLGSRRLSFASKGDLERMLGVQAGSVTPLAILNDVTCSISLVLDEEVRGRRVHAHPLVNTATLYIDCDDVERLAREHGNPVLWLEI